MTEERNGLPELPKGWVWTTIGEVTQSIEKVKPKENPDTQFTYLDISSIDNQLNKVVEPKIYYGSEAPSRARQLIRAHDVLFSTVRTYLKNIALVPEIYDGQIASTGFSVLRGESYISPKCLFYYSLTDQFINPLSELQRGTSYPAVRDSDVRVQLIPLPPAAEQHRIVAKIEELFTQLDAGVAALEKAKAQLLRYRQAVLKAAVEGELTREWREAHRGEIEPASVLLERILEERRAKWEAEHPGKRYKPPAPPETDDLPELPEGWVWATIGEVTQTIEKVKPKEKPDTQFTYLDISSIDNEINRVVKPKTYYGSEAPSRARQLVRAHDVLFSTVRTYLKNIALVPEIYDGQIASTGFSVLRGESRISPKYLFYYALTDQFVNPLSKLQRGTSYPAVRDGDVRAQPVPLPPAAEQHRIVAEVEQRLSVIDEMEKAVEQSLKRAERLRQSVLKRAFEGKLVAQDPSDEPASVLLERIKAEKARREGEGKGKRKGSRRKRRKTEEAEQLRML
jgi:type I restriction enzyme S subunit